MGREKHFHSLGKLPAGWSSLPAVRAVQTLPLRPGAVYLDVTYPVLFCFPPSPVTPSQRQSPEHTYGDTYTGQWVLEDAHMDTYTGQWGLEDSDVKPFFCYAWVMSF